jgi:hypothetical protein
VCLISDEHSTQLVWKNNENRQIDEGDDGAELFGDRVFGFTVEQTKEAEEAVTEEGFIVSKRKVDVMTSTHIQADSTCLHQTSHSASW